ncbi:vacuolar-sorting protein snf8 [Limosa lapponica baueri]|uniref:Vacuolar-sorting protein SNF8 n=1 Tax=Limosa lapponica baueri TaxID=1758121 RepID=A0A2I0TC29_LIMLA|nr:vacuolar-sorting protein snf8 [Limosa lapponica baueri]
MSKQLDMFKTNLEEFASKHKQEIRKNPEFRVQFQDMCATIGVDPLASGKGFWSEMLGVGDFYYELGVQIIEVCLALKHRNGGLITLEELHQQVLKGRGKFAQDVSQDDLLRAIKKLKVLGNGFGIIPVGGTYLIQSVPAELNMDHTVVLQLAEKKGYVTVSEIRSSLKWETERAKQVLNKDDRVGSSPTTMRSLKRGRAGGKVFKETGRGPRTTCNFVLSFLSKLP